MPRLRSSKSPAAGEPSFDPRSFALRARIGGLSMAATHDMRAIGRRSADARFRRYLAEVDAREPGLPDAERYRRAELLQRKAMAQLAMKGWHKRKGAQK